VGSCKNNKDGTYTYSEFSNIGDRVDIVAPGEKIYSTVNTKEYQNTCKKNEQFSWSGTSMATPHISGIAAMLFSIDSSLTGEKVKKMICDEKTSTEVKGFSKGMANAYRAVKKAVGVEATHVKVEKFDGDEEHTQYIVATGYDKDEDEVWTFQSETEPIGELDDMHEIGTFEDKYYLVAKGTIYAFQLKDGKLLWKVEDQGPVSDSVFGDDGTLYFCNYCEPDFIAIDKNGKVLVTIDYFYQDYTGAYKLDYKKDRVEVIMAGTPSGERETIVVNLDDYSYNIEYYPDMGTSEEEKAYKNFMNEGSYFSDIKFLNYIQYGVYDIDNDSTKELIIRGTNLYSYNEYYVYDLKDNKVQLVESYNSGRSEDSKSSVKKYINKISFYDFTVLCRTKFSKSQMRNLGTKLRVPDNIEVTRCEAEGPPWYWEGAGRWVLCVNLYNENQFLASAAIDPDTLELMREVLTYSEE
jgi:hypothetical protein